MSRPIPGGKFDRFTPPADKEKKRAITQRDLVPRVGDEERTLEKTINEYLTRDAFVFTDDISIKAHRGRVYLEGVVDSSLERERVENLVSQVEGVQEVINNLVVGQKHRHSDKIISENISRALQESHFANRGIGVSVKSGVVTVNGHLDTLKEKLDLIQMLLALPGVEDVQSHLRIGYETPPDDITLRNKVVLAISELPRLKVRDLKIRVTKGVVYLKGETDLLAEKRPLLEKVATVKGVSEIADHITYRVEETEEMELRKHLERAFSQNPNLSSAHVLFDIAGGTIFLRGEVHSNSQLYVIEEIISQFPQIKRVINEIHVLSQ